MTRILFRRRALAARQPVPAPKVADTARERKRVRFRWIGIGKPFWATLNGELCGMRKVTPYTAENAFHPDRPNYTMHLDTVVEVPNGLASLHSEGLAAYNSLANQGLLHTLRPADEWPPYSH